MATYEVVIRWLGGWDRTAGIFETIEEAERLRGILNESWDCGPDTRPLSSGFEAVVCDSARRELPRPCTCEHCGVEHYFADEHECTGIRCESAESELSDRELRDLSWYG